MNGLLLIGALIGTIVGLSADTPQKPLVNISGYIKSDSWWDTRQVVATRDKHILFYPAPRFVDVQGNDVNNKAEFQTLPIQTRVRAQMSGVDVLDAQVTAVLEGDFHGRSDETVNLFWMRHSYGLLEWTRTSFLFGYTWHPMFVVECFPDTVQFGSGLPFESFARNPQLRIRHAFDYFDLIGVLGSQAEFATNGDHGFSSSYLRNSAIPQAHLQVQVPWGEHLFGAGVDMKIIRPRLHTALLDAMDDPLYAENERLISVAGMAFAKFALTDMTLRAKVIYGQNMPELSMIGGYGVRSVNWITDQRTYTNIRTFSTWLELLREPYTVRRIPGTITTGFFAGFTKNFGSSEPLADLGSFPPSLSSINTYNDIIFSRGSTIDTSLRLAPRVVWDVHPLRFAAELMLDRTSYGNPDQYARVNNVCTVYNVRLLFAGYYFF